MSLSLASLQEALRQPFPPETIKWLPKLPRKNEQGQWVCLALPYADKRTYEDRLNELAFGEWSTPSTTPLVAGNKLIVPVTVVLCGVPHTDYGEAFLSSLSRKGEKREEENSATEAYSQGFRRACAQFGLGRYLYDLPKRWVSYDQTRQTITLSAQQQRQMVLQLYQSLGLRLPPASSPTTVVPTTSSAAQLGAKPGHQPETRTASLQGDTTGPAATEQQRSCLRKLCPQVGYPLPDESTLTQQAAAELIRHLSQQRQQQQRALRNGTHPPVVVTSAPASGGTAVTEHPLAGQNIVASTGLSTEQMQWIIGQYCPEMDVTVEDLCRRFVVSDLTRLTQAQYQALVEDLKQLQEEWRQWRAEHDQ